MILLLLIKLLNTANTITITHPIIIVLLLLLLLLIMMIAIMLTICLRVHSSRSPVEERIQDRIPVAKREVTYSRVDELTRRHEKVNKNVLWNRLSAARVCCVLLYTNVFVTRS